MPSWSSLHPVIVHFPISLLFVAPLFLLLGALTKKSVFQTTFLILLGVGTMGTMLAVSTGEAAGEKITVINDELLETLEQHESLAKKSRTVFVLLTLVGMCWQLFKHRLSIISTFIKTTAILIYIVAYGSGLIMLGNAAHHGGGLVHHHGVHSDLYQNKK